MNEEKEVTALEPFVGANEEQPGKLKTSHSISENDPEFNSLTEDSGDWEKKMLQKQLNPGYLETVTMSQLYNTVFEDRGAPVEGLLCKGTYLFAGAPKVGKSFLMLQLAYHIATGRPIWNYPVRRSGVLYLALEDDLPRLQRRLYRMFGTEETENLHLATECKTVAGGLEHQIRSFVAKHPNTKVVIIDTLKRVRESGGADYSYSSDYDIVARLKDIADSCGLTIIIVHHTRKQKAEDICEMISGTNGLLGAADGALILSKEKRTDLEAVLEIVGRDQPEQRIQLRKEKESLIWEFVSAETELWKEPPDPLLERIAAALPADGSRWVGTASDLCQQLGLDLKPNALSLKLNVGAGRLMKEYGVYYRRGRTRESRRILLWKDESGGV